MGKHLRKLIAALFACTLITSLLPATALAAESKGETRASTTTVVFDANGGNGSSKSYNLSEDSILEPGYENRTYSIKLPDPSEIGLSNGNKVFVGWSTDPSGHGKDYVAGLQYTVGEGASTTLYAIWLDTETNSSNQATAYFFIRIDGEIQMEPAGYGTDKYYPLGSATTLEGKLHQGLPVNNNLDAVDANIAIAPTDDEIKKVLAENRVSFDPDTQYIEWYVIKVRTQGTYNVDGVIRDKAKYAVTYYPNGGNERVPGSNEYAAGRTVSVSFNPIPTRLGYTFLGWDEDKDASEPTYKLGVDGSFRMPEKNVDLYAIWQSKANVTLHYVAREGGTVSLGSESLNPEIGEAKGSTALANAGYEFVSWTNKNGEVVSEKATFAPYKPSNGWVDGTTFYANFRRLTGSFSLTKEVEGNAANPNEVFTFEISREGLTGPYSATLTDANGGSPTSRGVSFVDGKATVQLSHGQTITITGIPTGALSVSETGLTPSVYRSVKVDGSQVDLLPADDGTQYTDSQTASVESGAMAAMKFTNVSVAPPATRYNLDVAPFAGLLAAGVAGAAGFAVARRRGAAGAWKE